MSTNNLFTATLNGETMECNGDNWHTVCESLMARHPGAGIPRVVKVEAPAPAVTLAPQSIADAERAGRLGIAAIAPASIPVGAMDTVGRDRATADIATAEANGFATGETVYPIGYRATGMRQYREAFDASPSVPDACDTLYAKVTMEDRRDVQVNAHTVRMDASGRLVVGDARYPIESSTVSPLSQRLGMTAAGAFLRSIPVAERAFNVNHAADRMEAGDTFKLRTRRSANGGGRYGWAVTGSDYTTVDADQLASIVKRTIREPGAKATIAYDGVRTLVNVLYMSDVTPEHAVAGEVFRAGVRIDTADNGTRSYRVRAFIGQNLCLNFVILHEGVQETGRFVHRGNAAALAYRIADAVKAARGKVDAFVRQWSYACADDMTAVVDALASDELVIEASAILQASVALTESRKLATRAMVGVLRKQSIPIPATAANAAALVRAWDADTSSARVLGGLSRASLVNAATRFAHESNGDPWVADAIESAAGQYLTRGALL